MKFYASVRLEVRRGKKIDKGDVTIGHELYLKVVKNKLAPPFRTGHTSLIYGRGIPRDVAVVDMAIDYGVIVKKGSWLAYKGETLGQGRDTVAQFLAEHKELQDEIVKGIMQKVGEGLGYMPDASEMQENSTETPAEPLEELPPDAEEDMLEISDSDSDSE